MASTGSWNLGRTHRGWFLSKLFSSAREPVSSGCGWTSCWKYKWCFVWLEWSPCSNSSLCQTARCLRRTRCTQCGHGSQVSLIFFWNYGCLRLGIWGAYDQSWFGLMLTLSGWTASGWVSSGCSHGRSTHSLYCLVSQILDYHAK